MSGNLRSSWILTSWELYQTSWYGFAVKYSQGWKKPLLKSASKGVSWEYRYQFRRDGDMGGYDDFGFDVVVYNRSKVGNLSQTDEFPISKNDVALNRMICEEPQIHMVEGEAYPVDKVSIRLDDERYYPTYFYILIRDDYLYTIVPIVSEKKYGAISEEEAKNIIPEFVTIASTFYPIDIVRPKPVVAKPRIIAPFPAAETDRDAQGQANLR